MKSTLEKINEFMTKYSQPKSDLTSISNCSGDKTIHFISAYLLLMSKQLEQRSKSKLINDRDPLLFRLTLILEEVGELLDSCYKGDEELFFDSIIDLLYVTLVLSCTYKLPIEEGIKEVHRSNMTKEFKGDVRLRAKGKKYSPPDLLSILRKEGLISR